MTRILHVSDDKDPFWFRVYLGFLLGTPFAMLAVEVLFHD